ncbi:MAG: DMT family transporter [Acetobacteraceae bacterium]
MPRSTGVLGGFLAGCVLALGAPISFAAARAGILAGITPGDLVLLRYLVAGLLLLPVLLYLGIGNLAGIGWGRGAILLLTGGPVFALLQTGGYAYAPLAHGGVIAPAGVTIFSTIIAAVALHERLSRSHLLGAGLVILGIVLIGCEGLRAASGERIWMGDMLFVASAIPWATFTVLVRYWRLEAVRVITVVSVLSISVTLPAYLAVAGTNHLLSLPMGELSTQALVQGGVQGILAMLGYTHAIRVLGVSRAVLFPAAVPAVSVLIGIPLLGEIPSMAQWLGLTLVTIGLLAAAGVPRRLLWQRKVCLS